MGLKLLYNAGYFKSGSIYGLIYLAENADTGKRYLVQPHDHDADNATAIKWLPYGKSTLDSAIPLGNAVFASAIPYSSIEEEVPSSQKNSDGTVIMENLPASVSDQNALRSTTGDQVPFFSKRGVTVDNVPTNLQAVTSQNYQLWKSGLLNTTTTVTAGTTGTTGTTNPLAKDTPKITGIAFIDSILMFFWENPLLMAVGIFLLLEAFGITNVLGLKKKRRRR